MRILLVTVKNCLHIRNSEKSYARKVYLQLDTIFEEQVSYAVQLY